MSGGLSAFRRCLAAAALAASGTALAQQLPVTREGLASALAQYFAGADRDRNGRLDRGETAEALGLARSMLTQRRDGPPLVMDVAPDGRPRLLLNEDGPLSRAGIFDLAYRLADRDGDDRLSLTEIQGVGRTAFDAADRDGDGILDEAERQTAVEQLQLFRSIFAAGI